MQYRMNYETNKIQVEGRKDESSDYGAYAYFDEKSRLIFYGDLPDELCKEIYDFLASECIILENGVAYRLTI